MTKRHIAILHRRKKTADGQARPTLVSIKTDGQISDFELATDDDELLFVNGRFPNSYLTPDPSEDISSFTQNPLFADSDHVTWRKIPKDKTADSYHPSHLREFKRKGLRRASRIPAELDGLQTGDTVLMFLGGSGDRLAHALSRHSEDLYECRIMRIPPFVFKDAGGNSEDPHSLFTVFTDNPNLFYETSPRDRDLIRAGVAQSLRKEAMKARIACKQRIEQGLQGRVFCDPHGASPELALEALLEAELANDEVYQALIAEETVRLSDLKEAIEKLPVYNFLLSQIEGISFRIAAPLICAIKDIRRFQVDPDHEKIANWRAENERLKGKIDFDSWRDEVDQGATFLTLLHRLKRELMDSGEFADMLMVEDIISLFHQMQRIKNQGGKADEIDNLQGKINALKADINFDERMSLISQQAREYEILRRLKIQFRLADWEHEAEIVESTLNNMGKISLEKRRARDRTIAKLQKFVGCAPGPDGRFPAKRRGKANVPKNPDARQALYLFADQCVRRPNSRWGQIFREKKASLRDKHPAKLTVAKRPVVFKVTVRQLENRLFSEHGIIMTDIMDDLGMEAITNKEDVGAIVMAASSLADDISEIDQWSYHELSDVNEGDISSETITLFSTGHTHNMAYWSTLRSFTQWLFKEWLRLEQRLAQNERSKLATAA